MLDVDYETLVGDLEGQSRRMMIDFLDLAWDDACLQFRGTERFVAHRHFWQVHPGPFIRPSGVGSIIARTSSRCWRLVGVVPSNHSTFRCRTPS